MSKTDCNNVRRQIDEAATLDQLSPASRNHVSECGACAQFNDERRKLRNMIGELSGVEAPADFDFKLRARLAASAEAKSGFSLSNLMGVKTVAFATLVVLFGFVLLLVSRQSGPQSIASSENLPEPAVIEGQKTPPPVIAVNPSNVEIASAASDQTTGARRNKNAASQFAVRNPRVRTSELSATEARVLRPTQFIDPGVFPLGASYQSLKVSVDDGRGGSSRTISLPTVSFGSSRALAQNPTPVMASTRDSW